MKKCLYLLICLALSCACFISCGESQPFAEKSYTADAQAVASINIDVRDRQIEVTKSTDNKVHINYFENSKEFYTVNINDGVLTMTLETNKQLADYIGTSPPAGERKISLQVPAAVLSSLNLTTTNKDITLSSLATIGTISLSSQGGNILFDKLNAENEIILNGKNGNISGTILGGYSDFAVTCTIKKGTSNLQSSTNKGAKPLTVTNNNGNINIDWN